MPGQSSLFRRAKAQSASGRNEKEDKECDSGPGTQRIDAAWPSMHENGGHESTEIIRCGEDASGPGHSRPHVSRTREQQGQRRGFSIISLCITCALFCDLIGNSPRAAAKKDSRANQGPKAVKLFEQGNFNEALSIFMTMNREDPTDHQVILNIALCLENMNDIEQAQTWYYKAQKANPTNIYVWNAIGNLHSRKGEGDAAVRAFTQAIGLNPRSDELFYNRGNAQQARGDHASAAKDFKKATKLRPDYYEAWNNMGSSYMSLMEYKKAIDALRKTLTFIPTHPIPLTNLVVMENRICDWSRRQYHLDLLRKSLYQEVQAGRSLVTPFHSFEFDLTPEECQMNAVQWTRRVDERVAYLSNFEAGGHKLPSGGTRLRIGYFSGSGFHNSTTTARSMRSQYGMHNRMYVEVYCYAGQPDDGSEVRKCHASCRGCDNHSMNA
jgi:tetratricopeptide (TPR) repeat protein